MAKDLSDSFFRKKWHHTQIHFYNFGAMLSQVGHLKNNKREYNSINNNNKSKDTALLVILMQPVNFKEIKSGHDSTALSNAASVKFSQYIHSFK